MDDLAQTLRDAGCDEGTSEAVRRLCEGRRVDDAIRVLRRHRCELMSCLHEDQRKVDCLDYLLRKMETA